MNKALPTPNQLMGMIGCMRMSIGHGDSRVIKYCLDTPVVAYGVGYNGFVCVIKTAKNLLRGYSYGVKHQHCRYYEAGFGQIEAERALEIIKNNKMLVNTGINEIEFASGREKLTDYERPIVAEFSVKSNHGYVLVYRIVRLKDGGLRGEHNSWKDTYNRYSLQGIASQYEKAKNGVDGYKMVSERFPPKILQEAKYQILIKEI